MNASCFLAPILLIAIHAVAFSSDAESAAKPDGTPAAFKRLQNPPPPYPENLKKKGIGGRVVVLATVDTIGKVSDIKILESSDPAFSEAVLKAVRQWTFKPATKDGQAVPAKYQIPFSFKSMKPVPEKSASGN